MRRLFRALTAVGLVALLFVAVAELGTAVGQTVQENVERTLGQLIVQNISCNAGWAADKQRIADLEKQLAEAKKAEPAVEAPK